MKPSLMPLCALMFMSAVIAAPMHAIGAEPGCNEKGVIDYTVKKGDTLWDISKSHLSDPFRWPTIWKDNTFIQDPDLIYPGQKIKIHCLPGAEAGAEKGEAEPAPEKAEAGPFVEPGKTIIKRPHDQSKVISADTGPKKKMPIYSESAVLAAGFITADLDGAVRIKGSPLGDRLTYSAGDELYVDSLPAMRKGVRYIIVRPEHEVDHPATGRDMGDLVRVTGVLRLEKEEDDLFLCKIERSFLEIKDTDLLLPYMEPELIYGPQPRNARLAGKWGYVVDTMGPKEKGELLGTVYLDMGSDEGVRPGDSFVIRRSGSYESLLTADKYLIPPVYQLPDVQVGELQVVSVQQGTATAKIVEMKEAVSPGYRVYYKD